MPTMFFSTRMLAMSRRSAVRLGGAGLVTALTPAFSHASQATDATTLAANKAIVQRVFAEGINHDDDNLTEILYAPDAISRNGAARQSPGPAGMPLSLQAFRAEFPDVSATLDITIAEGDIVAIHVIWYGNHPPKGTHVVGRSMHLFRISGAQIAEEWSVGWDWISRSSPRNALPAGNPLLNP
jgi:predicted SnoaL-like aldol condensation-catalyzing enzyme